MSQRPCRLRLSLVRQPLLALRCPRKCHCLRPKLGVQAKYSALGPYVIMTRICFQPDLGFDVLISTSFCKPSTLPTSGRTRKFLLTNPRPRIRNLSWLRLRAATLPTLPRALCLTLSIITSAVKVLSSRQRLSPTSMLTLLSWTMSRTRCHEPLLKSCIATGHS